MITSVTNTGLPYNQFVIPIVVGLVSALGSSYVTTITLKEQVRVLTNSITKQEEAFRAYQEKLDNRLMAIYIVQSQAESERAVLKEQIKSARGK